MATLNADQAFGNVLKRTREKKGISQEQLALDSGLHRTYISLIERGKRSPSLRTIERIVKALGSRLSVMMKEVEDYPGQKRANS